MIKFANSKFIFAIRGPKLARRNIEDKFIKHKIGDLLFYMHPWNDFTRTNNGGNSSRPMGPIGCIYPWKTQGFLICHT